MKRYVKGIGAAALMIVPIALFAQQKPLDDPNPPWKAELEKKATPRGPDGKPRLEGDVAAGR